MDEADRNKTLTHLEKSLSLRLLCLRHREVCAKGRILFTTPEVVNKTERPGGSAQPPTVTQGWCHTPCVGCDGVLSLAHRRSSLSLGKCRLGTQVTVMGCTGSGRSNHVRSVGQPNDDAE